MRVESIAEGVHSAILSTFTKLPCAIKILFCLFLSGRFTQVLLYFCLLLKIGYCSLAKQPVHLQSDQGFKLVFAIVRADNEWVTMPTTPKTGKFKLRPKPDTSPFT